MSISKWLCFYLLNRFPFNDILVEKCQNTNFSNNDFRVKNYFTFSLCTFSLESPYVYHIKTYLRKEYNNNKDFTSILFFLTLHPKTICCFNTDVLFPKKKLSEICYYLSFECKLKWEKNLLINISIPSRQLQWRRSGIFIVNFKHISYLVLVFLLFTLNM